MFAPYFVFLRPRKTNSFYAGSTFLQGVLSEGARLYRLSPMVRLAFLVLVDYPLRVSVFEGGDLRRHQAHLVAWANCEEGYLMDGTRTRLRCNMVSANTNFVAPSSKFDVVRPEIYLLARVCAVPSVFGLFL